jgi:hypothetical protein
VIHHSTEGNVHVMQLDSIADLDTTKIPRGWPNEDHFRSHNYGTAENSRWVGGTKHEIATYLTTGWPQGTELVQRLADKMRGQLEKPKSFKRRQKWMEDGDEPSWEREQAGHSTIWRTSRRETMRGPTTVELLGTWGGNANLSADQLRWDGVVMVVLTDLLEEAGYRVGLTLNAPVRFSWGSGAGKFNLAQLVVKEPNMPLDIASLVPVVTHPGVFRWHGINLASLCPFDCGGGHGSAIELRHLPPVSVVRKTAIMLGHAYYESNAVQEIQRVLDLFKDTSAVSTYIP